MRIRIIIFTILILCTACTTHEDPGPIPTRMCKSYIWAYNDLESIRLLERVYFSVDEVHRTIDGQNIDNIFREGNQGKYYRISDRIALFAEVISDLIADDLNETAQRYEALRDELGDTFYNTKVSMIADRPVALTGTIDAISIFVNEDYATDYPAGANASALFTIFYEYFHAVILNNYQSPPDTYRWTTSYDIPQAGYRYKLSEVDLRGKKAIGDEFYFLLNGAPAKTGEYSFTVEVKTADGRTLTATTRPIPITVP